MTDSQIAEAKRHLSQKDPVMADLISRYGEVDRRRYDPPFLSLARKIVSQQISVKAAASVWQKLLDFVDGELIPERLHTIEVENYRSVGISRQKASYLIDLSKHFIEDAPFFDDLHQQSDEDVIEALTAVRGIGVWTAQMFLMFDLGRPDIFAPDDVGLQNAMKGLYVWENEPKKKDLVRKAEDWAPHRTLACWYLWQSLHNSPE